MLGEIGPAEWFAVLIGLTIVVLPYWKIATKAGYSGALSLLMLIPVVNVLFPFFLGFAEWPIERELRRLRES
ncbi:MAG: hypothetical protein ACM3ZA_00680 [Bacillota bacterium]